MEERRLTSFGTKVKVALVKKGLTQKWLIDEVHKRTGLYFDRAYMNKTLKGKYENPKIVEAIKDILGI